MTSDQSMKRVRVAAPPQGPAFHHAGRDVRLSTNEPVGAADVRCCDFCGQEPTEDLPTATNGKGSICRNCAADVLQMYADREPPVTFTPQDIPKGLVEEARAALSLHLGAGGGQADLDTTIRVIAAVVLPWGRP
jgi:hypothetical protein